MTFWINNTHTHMSNQKRNSETRKHANSNQAGTREVYKGRNTHAHTKRKEKRRREGKGRGTREEERDQTRRRGWVGVGGIAVMRRIPNVLIESKASVVYPRPALQMSPLLVVNAEVRTQHKTGII